MKTQNEKLRKIIKQAQKNNLLGEDKLILVPKSLRQTIIHLNHNLPTVGHRAV